MSLIVFVGTGTGVGKTHLSASFLRATPSGVSCAAYKPFESGVLDVDQPGDDERTLRAAAQGEVPPALRFVAPLAPPMAADDAGVELRADRVVFMIDELTRAADHVVLELAGGLFSPFLWGVANAEFLHDLTATRDLRLVLVAPDRLGVLHDVAATTRAALHVGLHVSALLLSAPAEPDASTGRNLDALRHDPLSMHITPIYGVPRGPVEELAEHPNMRQLWSDLRLA
jgi:dethiobiotin synthetase